MNRHDDPVAVFFQGGPWNGTQRILECYSPYYRVAVFDDVLPRFDRRDSVADAPVKIATYQLSPPKHGQCVAEYKGIGA